MLTCYCSRMPLSLSLLAQAGALHVVVSSTSVCTRTFSSPLTECASELDRAKRRVAVDLRLISRSFECLDLVHKHAFLVRCSCKCRYYKHGKSTHQAWFLVGGCEPENNILVLVQIVH